MSRSLPEWIDTCASCGKTFPRAYRISQRRAAKPKYCSPECFAEGRRKFAEQQLAKRFWSRVRVGRDNECWPWTGRRDPKGYGLFDDGKRPHIASRFAYRLVAGGDELPPDRLVCHHCDNPPCCNPSHLFLGTPKDNTQDSIRKGRFAGFGHSRSVA